MQRLTPGTCLSWIPAEQLGGVGGIYPLHRPRVGWREDAVLRLVLEHRKEPYDKYRCGARFEFFQQSDARTIPAKVNTGGITRDILFMPSASCRWRWVRKVDSP